MSAELKKTRGVESFELAGNQDLLRIILKPDNALRIEQIWEVIRRNGITLREARVTVRGEIRFEGGKPQLQATGSGPAYELIGEAEEIRRHSGETIVMEGETTPGPRLRDPAPIRWKSVKLPAGSSGKI